MALRMVRPKLRPIAQVWGLMLLLLSICRVETFAPEPQRRTAATNASMARASRVASTSLHASKHKKEGESYKARNLGDLIKEFVKNVAELSLQDYEWRSNLFRSLDADRLMEESLARMRGDEAPYVRPMDASSLGPLGRAEKNAVTWLSRVIEEEGARAQMILNQNGQLVRPIDVEGTAGEGPLAEIEQSVVDGLNQIRDSEMMRKSLGIVRPKDLDESVRGPLGNAEARLYQAFKDLSTAENLRLEQSKQRGGNVVRPIDVPGPIGEVEAAVMQIIDAERQRAGENEGAIVRPMNAAVKGPLGEAEEKVIVVFDKLSEEERDRLRGILRILEDNRPMETDRSSPLGLVEAFIVGLLRGPQMLVSVVDRVRELLQSETLSEQDQEQIQEVMLKMPEQPEEDLGAFE